MAKFNREAWKALRSYPRLKQKQSDYTDISMTANYNGMPSSHSASRTTENIALKPKLTDREERIVRAVEKMLEMQSYYPNRDERMKFIELVYFRHTHTIEGAAMEVHYSTEACKRWSAEIIAAVYAAL